MRPEKIASRMMEATCALTVALLMGFNLAPCTGAIIDNREGCVKRSIVRDSPLKRRNAQTKTIRRIGCRRSASLRRGSRLRHGRLSTRTSICTIPIDPQGIPWPPNDNQLLYRPTMPADFQAATRGLGVTGAIVVEASVWLDDNQCILDLARDNPIIKGFVGHLEPGDSFRKNLERFSKNPLFRGVRLSGRTIAAACRALTLSTI